MLICQPERAGPAPPPLIQMHTRLKRMLLLTGQHKMCKSGGQTPFSKQWSVRQTMNNTQKLSTYSVLVIGAGVFGGVEEWVLANFNTSWVSSKLQRFMGSSKFLHFMGSSKLLHCIGSSKL